MAASCAWVGLSTMLIVGAVAAGAALGAVCRYLLEAAVQSRHRQRFPYGILLINLLGSAVLGLLIGLAAGRGLPTAVFAVAGTGWCGAFTTYSTFGYQTVCLAREGFTRAAAANVVLSVFGGLALAWLGFVVGRAL